MITDYADNLHLYGDLQEYADMVLAFIEKQKKARIFRQADMIWRRACLRLCRAILQDR